MPVRRACEGINRPPGVSCTSSIAARGDRVRLTSRRALHRAIAELRCLHRRGAAMKKPLLMLALLGTVSYGAYRMIGSSSTKTSEQVVVNDGEQLVLDRIWIDHIPKND